MADDEDLFSLIINRLDKSHKDDEALFELTGIDLTKQKQDLWFAVEALLKIKYGQDAFDMIMWFILDRFDINGKVVPFEDGKGQVFSLITPSDLYYFLHHRFPHINLDT